jgi:hypothetical protein
MDRRGFLGMFLAIPAALAAGTLPFDNGPWPVPTVPVPYLPLYSCPMISLQEMRDMEILRYCIKDAKLAVLREHWPIEVKTEGKHAIP